MSLLTLAPVAMLVITGLSDFPGVVQPVWLSVVSGGLVPALRRSSLGAPQPGFAVSRPYPALHARSVGETPIQVRGDGVAVVNSLGVARLHSAIPASLARLLDTAMLVLVSGMPADNSYRPGVGLLSMRERAAQLGEQ